VPLFIFSRLVTLNKIAKALNVIVAATAWRTSFDTYRAEEQAAYNALRTDTDWLANRQRYHHAFDRVAINTVRMQDKEPV